MRRLALLLAIFAAPASPRTASAWDGLDAETGSGVEIKCGNLVRSVGTIEIYDRQAGEYRDVDVLDISRYGSTVDVYDPERGCRTFEMEDWRARRPSLALAGGHSLPRRQCRLDGRVRVEPAAQLPVSGAGPAWRRPAGGSGHQSGAPAGFWASTARCSATWPGHDRTRSC